MPRITLQAESKRFPLKSLPPDGYVLIRPMTYGQTLERRQLATRLSMEQAARAKRSGTSESKSEFKPSRMDVDIMQRASREYEYANCIVEHNIESPGGDLLNFSNPKAIDLLPKALGEEIEEYLDEMNGEEDEEDVAPLVSPSTQSSPEATEVSPKS